MKYDVLYNFISPVTGRVLSDQNYVLYGNRLGIAIPSPIIIDIRLDLINLRKDYNELKKDYRFSSNATFVLNIPNPKLPNAQALNQLVGVTPRILKANTDGIIEVAISDTDYATVTRLEGLAAAAGASATAAGASAAAAGVSAGEALISAGKAFASAGEASASAIKATAEAKIAVEAAASVFGITKVVAGGITAASTLAGIAEDAADKAEQWAEKAQDAAQLVQNAGIKLIIRDTTAVTGIPGAAGAAGVNTLLIDSNLNLNGSRIENIAASPEGDYDAVSAKFAWNLINDKVEIVWQKSDS